MNRNHGILATIAWLCDEYGAAFTYTDGEIVIDTTGQSDRPAGPGQHSPRTRLHGRMIRYLGRFGVDFEPNGDDDIAATTDGITIRIPNGQRALSASRLWRQGAA